MVAPRLSNGSTFWTVNSVPPTLAAKVVVNCSTVISGNAVNSPPPAFAKTTSRPRPRPATASATASRSSAFDTSARIPLAPSPIEATALSSSGCGR